MDRYSITLKREVTQEITPEITEFDVTTFPRYAVNFPGSQSRKLEPSQQIDISKRMEKWLVRDIENKVKNWLDSEGAESSQLTLELELSGCEQFLLTFERSEIALKTCANNWSIYHIAHESRWPRILSSREKLVVQMMSNAFVTLKNEVRSLDYSIEEENQVREAVALKSEAEDEKVRKLKEEIDRAIVPDDFSLNKEEEKIEKIDDDPPF